MTDSRRPPAGRSADLTAWPPSLRRSNEQQEPAPGFAIEEQTEGPWQQDEYAYHHLLSRARARPG